MSVLLFETFQKVAGLKPCRKTQIAHARQIDESFAVKTKEGYHDGKPGDYLMQGIEGELYVCDRAIFEKTYKFIEEEAAE